MSRILQLTPEVEVDISEIDPYCSESPDGKHDWDIRKESPGSVRPPAARCNHCLLWVLPDSFPLAGYDCYVVPRTDIGLSLSGSVISLSSRRRIDRAG